MDSMDGSAIVQHVISNRNNYYRILFLDRTASADQIKAAYKRMALRCHPDKNKHTGASEAFKLVSTANSVLSDSTRRRIYDIQGAEAVQRHESGGGATARGGHQRYNQRHNDIFEELFARHTGANGAMPFVYEAEGNANTLLLAPLLIFLFMSLLLQSFLTDLTEIPSASARRGGRGVGTPDADSFSLIPDPARRHTVERMTSLNGARVKYYVHESWADKAARGYADVRSMEKEVLRKQLEFLARRCEADSLMYRARGRKGSPPICSDFEKLRRTAT
ncbi:putative chaperone protein DNAj [Trypanosoma vivax]|nr:putative chaperone protein DNAj [Trypanosoma vivax]